LVLYNLFFLTFWS